MNEIGIVSRLATMGGITFTVNTAVFNVSAGLTGTPDLQLNVGTKFLQQGDQCIIEGFSFNCPFQFGQGQINNAGVAGQPAFIQLGWRDNSGNNGAITEIGDNGRLNIPDPNYWYDTNTLFPQPAAVADKYFIEILGLAFEVSMFNVPAALDTDELDCSFHLKIRHTLPLIA
jgi:hypothetical protein